MNCEVEEFDFGFCAMVLRPGNKFWLFHMPRKVLDMVNKVLVEATKPLEKGRILVNLHTKLNAAAFYLPCSGGFGACEDEAGGNFQRAG